MPLCGFDEQMLVGLEAFYSGLVQAVIRKARERGTSVEEAIAIELREMNDFLRELIILDNALNREKLISITNYAKAFYIGSIKQSKDKSISIEDAMNSQIHETKNFLFEVDNYYYKYLEGKKNAMQMLVKWIEQRRD